MPCFLLCNSLRSRRAHRCHSRTRITTTAIIGATSVPRPPKCVREQRTYYSSYQPNLLQETLWYQSPTPKYSDVRQEVDEHAIACDSQRFEGGGNKFHPLQALGVILFFFFPFDDSGKPYIRYTPSYLKISVWEPEEKDGQVLFQRRPQSCRENFMDARSRVEWIGGQAGRATDLGRV